MIQTINYFFTRVFDIILYPFGFLPEFVGIFFLSALMALVVLVIYKRISSADAVKNTKDQIKASILAIRIYKDFWKVIVASFFKSLFYTLKYFILNFGPVLVILPILFPAFVQMDVRYGVRPFNVGEKIAVKASLTRDPNTVDARLQEDPHFKVTMNPVVINAFEDLEERKHPIRQVNWKVEAVKEGTADFKIDVAGKTYTKSVVIGPSRAALSNKKLLASSWAHFFYPVEKLLEKNEDVEYLYIRYPGRNVSIFGFEIHWIVLNLILVVVLALAFRKRFGVEF